MTEAEFNKFYSNWQNPRAVTIPESPSIPSGNMMPVAGPRNGLQALNKTNPMAFNVAPVAIPDIEIPSRGAEILRDLRNQPRQLGFTGANAAQTVINNPSPPPRPLSGNVPAVANGRAGLNFPVPQQPATAVFNASALVTRPQAGSPAQRGSQNFTGRPIIEGEVVKNDLVPSKAEIDRSGNGGRGSAGKVQSAPTGGTGRAGASIGRSLPLLGESGFDVLDLIWNAGENYVKTPLGIADSAQLGLAQKKYDMMTEDGRQQFFPDGRPAYQAPATADPATVNVPPHDLNPANPFGVPRNAYTAAVINGTYRNPIDTYIDQASSDVRAAQWSPPPIPPGFSDIANGVGEVWSRLENSGSNRLTPQQAKQQTIAAGEPPPSMPPALAMELLQSTQQSDPIVPGSPPPNPPAAAPGLNRLEAQKDYTPPAIPATSNAGGDLNGTLSVLGNRPAYQAIAKRGETANLAAQGYRSLELPGSAPGGTLDSQVWKQASAPKPLSQMPQAVQDQAARQGITDLNTLYEQMNYTVPGAKGSATGWRKVDPNRPQGSFSVAPALSESDQQRYNQIVANETRQREYAQGRGPQWDAAQANQASNAVAALKQVMAQQKDQRDYGLQKETLAETKSKNRMDAEAKAAQIEQSLLAERHKANRVDPKWIPTLASILETEQKNAPLGNKITSNQHLSNGLLTRGIKTATDLKNPPDGLFIHPDDPSQVFMRDPKTHAVTSLGLTEDYLKRWAMNHYAGTGADPIERVAPPSP